jgi:hypothetical protein
MAWWAADRGLVELWMRVALGVLFVRAAPGRVACLAKLSRKQPALTKCEILYTCIQSCSSTSGAAVASCSPAPAPAGRSFVARNASAHELAAASTCGVAPRCSALRRMRMGENDRNESKSADGGLFVTSTGSTGGQGNPRSKTDRPSVTARRSRRDGTP